ncbi:MAG: calmodulin-binding protein [Thermoguttaceae bacterium]
MFYRVGILFFCAMICYLTFAVCEVNAQQQAYGQTWNSPYTLEDWQRYYYYPYKYYPQNFEVLNYNEVMSNPGQPYPPEMRIPPYYDKRWQNYFPSPRKYHSGRHFHLDMF